jgi:hypothetical protein
VTHAIDSAALKSGKLEIWPESSLQNAEFVPGAEWPAFLTTFQKLLRAVDSLQLTANHQVATPVNWRQGEDVIIVPAVSDEDAKKRYPTGWNAMKPYLRVVPSPSVKAG